MEFALLGSGSRGNAALVRAGSTLVMVDCGFSLSECERRLARLGVGVDEVDAMLVTHEHADHVSGAGRFAERCGIPVYASAGTRRAAMAKALPERTETFDSHAAFAVGDLEITPLIVPHDAAEPTQFVFGNGNKRLGVVTDLGHATPFLLGELGGLNGLVLESNHDDGLLAASRYPPKLKQRVGGEYGHLSNAQTASLLSALDLGRLSRLALAHLSEQNNRPELARTSAVDAVGCEPAFIKIATQDAGLEWQSL